tara:strand:- start:1224 stop:1886 length:663 start_codon:yes stop_codon:yes gene_type:complete
MPTKIRLQRHGKKKYAYFHVVIADSRAPRDGKFIEKIGTYNPNTNPATIDIDFDRSLTWVKKGAQPTETVKALLSYKGVIYKNHLDKGVDKGAFSQEDAEKKFEAWLQEKEDKITSKKDKLSASVQEETKKRLAAEKEINEKRAASISAKLQDTASEVAESVADAAESAVDTVSETAEAVADAVEEKVEEVKEAISSEKEVATEETKEEENKEDEKKSAE